MSNAATVRTHNLAEIDVTDLAAVREAREQACAIGHWRRILAIYGDHLPACAARPAIATDGLAANLLCDCGWVEVFAP